MQNPQEICEICPPKNLKCNPLLNVKHERPFSGNTAVWNNASPEPMQVQLDTCHPNPPTAQRRNRTRHIDVPAHCGERDFAVGHRWDASPNQPLATAQQQEHVVPAHRPLQRREPGGGWGCRKKNNFQPSRVIELKKPSHTCTCMSSQRLKTRPKMQTIQL